MIKSCWEWNFLTWYTADAHSYTKEEELNGTMALEQEPGEKDGGSLVVLCHAEEEKEGEIQPGHGEAQEETDHHWSEAVDQGEYALSRTRHLITAIAVSLLLNRVV